MGEGFRVFARRVGTSCHYPVPKGHHGRFSIAFTIEASHSLSTGLLVSYSLRSRGLFESLRQGF